MKFGVIAPNFNAPKQIVEFTKVAEESGYDHFLLSDHYWFEEEPDFLDSWTMLALLAGETSTLRLGTCVTPISFRPPLQFAKIVTTLHFSSAAGATTASYDSQDKRATAGPQLDLAAEKP